MVGWWRWALVSPDGVALSRMVGVSASVNVPLHHKVQNFSSGTGSHGWSRKKGHKTVVEWYDLIIEKIHPVQLMNAWFTAKSQTKTTDVAHVGCYHPH